MKLLGLLDLTLLFILACHVNGEQWNIFVKSNFQVKAGEDVTIDCSFTSPNQSQGDDVQVYWKKYRRRTIVVKDNDLNEFVFHPNVEYVCEEYKGKTKLSGKPEDRVCSLTIQNVQINDLLYVRVSVNGTYYNFKRNVRIHIEEVNAASYGPEPTYAPMFSTSGYRMEKDLTPPVLFAAIFTPLLVLVIIALVIGALFCVKRKKREESLTREESGYYANVSRETSNQTNRKAPPQSKEHKKLSQDNEMKCIDEPIYVNTQNLKSYDDEMDQTQNIYANY